MKAVTPIRILFGLVLITGLGIFIFATQKEKHQEKQKGAHVFGMTDSYDFDYLKKDNIEWVTLVPWADQENTESPNLRHKRGDSLDVKKANDDWIEQINQAREAGFSVFIKPHVWIYKPANGKWRSDIFPSSSKNWDEWKASYQDFILRFAQISEKAQADMFCLGTEFTRLTLEKPEFWKNLIKEVRRIYSGKIVYAANWYQEFEKIDFWQDLDYIGIQAYFPLASTENPNLEELSKGWENYISTLEELSVKLDRKILFTEIGYKSTTDSAIRPWEWVEDQKNSKKTFSEETQALCYQAFFNSIWPKDWFSGMHFWQIRSDDLKFRSETDMDFTPRGKSAEKVIRKGFE